MIQELTQLEEWESFLQQGGKRLLFKHSTQCPISAKAHQEFMSYMENQQEVPAALVKVIESRPVSNAIADHFQIKHESPQIFLLDGQEVLWHTSHRNINKDAITEQVQA